MSVPDATLVQRPPRVHVPIRGSATPGWLVLLPGPEPALHQV